MDSIARVAIKTWCHYINKKWLSGMLTNWSTTKMRFQKFMDLRTEQKDRETQSSFEKRCNYVEETIISLASIFGWD